MKLDVGCGHRFEGDVNIDLFTAPTKHRMLGLPDPNAPDDPLGHIPNLIRAECTFLPLRDNVFDLAVSNHLIEHIDEPFHMLKEMVRVTKNNGEIHVETPHKLSHRRKWSLHKHSFNLSWFVKAFKLLRVELVESQKNYRCYPHEYVPLIRVPYFIKVTGRVKNSEHNTSGVGMEPIKIIDIADMPKFNPIVKSGLHSVSEGKIFWADNNYVTCKEHGACLCVSKTRRIWRCPTCNEGAYVEWG